MLFYAGTDYIVEKPSPLSCAIPAYSNQGHSLPDLQQELTLFEYRSAHSHSGYALTDKRSSPLVEYADHVFFALTESPHYYPSVVSTVLMVEILLSAAVAASDTLDRIKQVEHVQNKSGAYL